MELGLDELDAQGRLDWSDEMRLYLLEVEYHREVKGLDMKEPCIQWGDQLFTIQEAKRRCTALDKLVFDHVAWCEEWEKIPRRIQRKRKNAPPKVRLKAYIQGCFKRRKRGGAWMTLPTIKALAKSLALSESSIKRALKEIEEEEEGMTFRSANSQNGRGRVKYVALTSWLKHDKEPLLYTEEGKSRGMRTSFRATGKLILTALKYPAPKPIPEGEETTKVQKCLSCISIREKGFSQLSENKPRGGWLEPLARKIIQGKTMDHEKPERPHVPRLDRILDVDELVFNAVLNLLRAGYWRMDALRIAYRALRLTDTAIADEMPRNAERYFWGILRQKKEEVRKPSRREINSERSRFYHQLASETEALAVEWSANESGDFEAEMAQSMQSRADELRTRARALAA